MKAVRRFASAAAAIAGAAGALVGAAGCQGTTPTLQGAIDGLTEGLREMLGATSLPGKYVQDIYACHVDDRAWRFRPDAEKPLDRTRTAVRGLATADYGSWRETAVVVSLLSAMSADHPSALVRADCLDALARMSVWTSEALPAAGRRATEQEAAAAIQRIVQASKLAEDDASAAPELASALDTIAAFRFDEARQAPTAIDLAVLARSSRTQLSTSRGVLRALTGGALGRHDADPRVRDALDRALVATVASSIRLALVAAASGAPEEIVRSAAVRDLELARPDRAAAILGAVLAADDQSSVRREAARALGSFPVEECAPHLLRALSDDRVEVRAAAANALAAASGQSFGDDRRAWARWWDARSGATPSPAGDAGAK